MWTYKERCTGEEQTPTGYWTVTMDDGDCFDVEEDLAILIVETVNKYLTHDEDDGVTADELQDNAKGRFRGGLTGPSDLEQSLDRVWDISTADIARFARNPKDD